MQKSEGRRALLLVTASSAAALLARYRAWLVQVGFGRAGFYSYDLLDNLGRPSADTILDEPRSPTSR